MGRNGIRDRTVISFGFFFELKIKLDQSESLTVKITLKFNQDNHVTLLSVGRFYRLVVDIQITAVKTSRKKLCI